jgi:WD40 repeat protein
VWEVATGACTATLTGHADYVRSVCMSPEGTHVVSGSDDKTIKVWEVATGACTATLTGHADTVRSVCMSPEGTHVVSGSGDSKVCCWDAYNLDKMD